MKLFSTQSSEQNAFKDRIMNELLCANQELETTRNTVTELTTDLENLKIAVSERDSTIVDQESRIEHTSIENHALTEDKASLISNLTSKQVEIEDLKESIHRITREKVCLFILLNK